MRQLAWTQGSGPSTVSLESNSFNLLCPLRSGVFTSSGARVWTVSVLEKLDLLSESVGGRPGVDGDGQP